jgi:hypothetical protein
MSWEVAKESLVSCFVGRQKQQALLLQEVGRAD